MWKVFSASQLFTGCAVTVYGDHIKKKKRQQALPQICAALSLLCPAGPAPPPLLPCAAPLPLILDLPLIVVFFGVVNGMSIFLMKPWQCGGTLCTKGSSNICSLTSSHSKLKRPLQDQIKQKKSYFLTLAKSKSRTCYMKENDPNKPYRFLTEKSVVRGTVRSVELRTQGVHKSM